MLRAYQTDTERLAAFSTLNRELERHGVQLKQKLGVLVFFLGEHPLFHTNSIDIARGYAFALMQLGTGSITKAVDSSKVELVDMLTHLRAKESTDA